VVGKELPDRYNRAELQSKMRKELGLSRAHADHGDIESRHPALRRVASTGVGAVGRTGEESETERAALIDQENKYAREVRGVSR
jgi:hypothetical protein